jgi:hypothetical protein
LVHAACLHPKRKLCDRDRLVAIELIDARGDVDAARLRVAADQEHAAAGVVVSKRERIVVTAARS